VDADVDFVPQFEISTSHGTFKIDFLVVLSWYYPEIFDKRGIENLKRFCDNEILEDDFYKGLNISPIEFTYKGVEYP